MKGKEERERKAGGRVEREWASRGEGKKTVLKNDERRLFGRKVSQFFLPASSGFSL
jgi:hypothetical protein